MTASPKSKFTGHTNMSQVARDCDTHCRNVRQLCKHYGVPVVATVGGRTVWIPDEHVPYLTDLIEQTGSWRATLVAISRA